MLTPAEWKAKEKELERLITKREALKSETAEVSKRIHILSVDIRAYKKRTNSPKPVRTNTFAYQMFGKQLKDLTHDEYKIYYNARQRINREKRKGNVK